MRSNHRAPIGACFASIEGESSRIGERTAFIHVANGIYRTAEEVVEREVGALSSARRIVLDVCEVGAHFDWVPFAESFAEVLGPRCRDLVLETRGERHIPTEFRDRVPIYLNLTLGYTVLLPDNLKPGRDEVKFLLNDLSEVEVGITELEPFAQSGLECFLFPRVEEAREAAPYFSRFMARNAHPNIRMMLVEHEVVGHD